MSLGHNCITESSEFTQVCLCRPVLRTALIGINDLRGDGAKRNPVDAVRRKEGKQEEDDIPNKSYRFAGYKQFTWWVHQRLGKGVRRVIPSCALWLFEICTHQVTKLIKLFRKKETTRRTLFPMNENEHLILYLLHCNKSQIKRLL